jgi:hypothetical protein
MEQKGMEEWRKEKQNLVYFTERTFFFTETQLLCKVESINWVSIETAGLESMLWQWSWLCSQVLVWASLSSFVKQG